MHTEGYGLRSKELLPFFVREFAVDVADFGVNRHHANEKRGYREASAFPKRAYRTLRALAKRAY